MIQNYDTFNEDFMGIDLKKIKDAAFKFHNTKDCFNVFKEIDSTLLNSVVEELETLKKRWINIDNLFKKIINKADSKNESVFSTILFTAFGIHAFIKLLVALKGNYTFRRYLAILFYTDSYNGEAKTVRDLIISVSFCIYLLTYIVGNNANVSDYYSMNGRNVCLPYKWNVFLIYFTSTIGSFFKISSNFLSRFFSFDPILFKISSSIGSISISKLLSIYLSYNNCSSMVKFL